MNYKKQGKFLNLTLNLSLIVFILLALIFLLEPSFRDKPTFAISYFDNPKVSYEVPRLPSSPVAQSDPVTQNEPVSQQKSHAPEPATLFLFLSGLGGLIVRYARRSFDRFKRYSDLCLSILGLTVTSPLLLFAAILIKLNSKGPIIYKQDRVGKFGEIFQIYKLRTMRVDAEKGIGAVWARENDPRITSVGRVLRKAHIDEIPQLFNVLKGEMSIVGPRPERPELVRDLKEFIHDYEKRLQVTPGITGFAQVWHKYDETVKDVKKKIKYDLLYIRRMCLLVDLRILAQTIVVVLTGRGAR
jgi:lipopolysaccharide/colanic/teichoic acid biosynthesis glycosyltransferase